MTGWIQVIQVNRCVGNPILERRKIARQLNGSSRSHGMSDEAFGIVYQGRRAISKYVSYRFAFLLISLWGGSRMRAQQVHIFGVQMGIVESLSNTFFLPLWVGKDIIRPIRIDSVSDDFRYQDETPRLPGS